MKELVKPNGQEQVNSNGIDAFCETHCTRTDGRGSCNRACDCRTYSNDSVITEDDIIF